MKHLVLLLLITPLLAMGFPTRPGFLPPSHPFVPTQPRFLPPNRDVILAAERAPIDIRAEAKDWLKENGYDLPDDCILIDVPFTQLVRGDLVQFDDDSTAKWGFVFLVTKEGNMAVDVGNSTMFVFIRVKPDQVKAALRSVKATEAPKTI